MESPEGGAKEGEEEEDEDNLTLAGSGGTKGDGGTLEGGEGRGLLLHLGLGVLQLGGDGIVGIELQLHLVLQVVELGAHTLEDDILVGIAERGIELTGLVVLTLGLDIELLIVLQVLTGLAGAVVGDELLQTCLDGVGNSGTDEGVLVGNLNGDDEGLLIDITLDTAIDGSGDSGLTFGQTEGIDILVSGEW